MKKIIQQIVSAIALIIVLISFSPISFAATDWYGAADNSGNISVGIGSRGVFSGSGGGGGWALSNPYGLPSGSILGIASNILFWMLAMFAIMGVIGFVLSGIWYLVGAGDEGMAEKGKEGMKFSIIGIIIGLSGFIIMQAVSALLGGASKTF